MIGTGADRLEACRQNTYLPHTYLKRHRARTQHVEAAPSVLVGDIAGAPAPVTKITRLTNVKESWEPRGVLHQGGRHYLRDTRPALVRSVSLPISTTSPLSADESE